MRRLLERSLGEIDLTGTELPAHVIATDVLSGAEVILSKGSAGRPQYSVHQDCGVWILLG